MHAALEIAIAREDIADDKLVVADRFRDFRRERPAVADTRWCSRNDEEKKKTKLFQVGASSRLDEIVGDGLGPRSQARFHHGFGPRRARRLLATRPAAGRGPTDSTYWCQLVIAAMTTAMPGGSDPTDTLDHPWPA